MADLKLGILSEHAPVQAIYIGATVKADDHESSSYVVHHGQLLFVKKNNQSNMPEVYNKYGDEMVPFGVAHDSVLDGKLAMENPESVAIVSVIVSGCVTMLADADAKVGDTLYVKQAQGATYDMGDKTYNAPTYTTAEDGGIRIGRVVEVYPSKYGVLRVALNIGVDPSTHFTDLSKGEKMADVTMAPQHPVYACLKNRQHQWNEGHPVFSNGDHHTTVFPDSQMRIVGLAADTAAENADKNTNAVATQIAGAGSCTLTLKTLGKHISVGAVIGCGATTTDASMTMRVLARPGNTEYYVLIGHHYSKNDPGGGGLIATPLKPSDTTAITASFQAAAPAKKAKTSKGSKTTKLR